MLTKDIEDRGDRAAVDPAWEPLAATAEIKLATVDL